MGYKVLLTLDLPEATSTERNKFYEYLKKENWGKLPDLTTAWKCSFKDDVEREEAIQICKKDLSNAADASAVSKYSAALQLGKAKIVEI